MKKELTLAAALVGLTCSLQAQATTTWIPIAVGDITTIIPYVPSVNFMAPSNTVFTQNGAVNTLSWDDIEHASRYEVQAMNSQGIWVSIITTEDTSVVIDYRFSGYSVVRVVACTFSSCADTGAWSTSVRINSRIIFIHTDLLGSPVAETDENGAVL